MKNIVFYVSVSLLLSSCFNINKMYEEAKVEQEAYYDSFNGKSAHELVQLEGPPKQKVSDENGGEIYVYERVFTSKRYINNVWTDYLAKETKMFYLNHNKVVYNFTSKTEPLPENNQIIINTN